MQNAPNMFPSNFTECLNLSAPETDFRQFNISKHTVFAQPVALCYNFEAQNSDSSACLQSYANSRKQTFNEQILLEQIQKIDISQCKIVNELVKVMIINARISDLDEFKRYLPDVWVLVEQQSEAERRVEVDCLEQMFAAVKQKE
ncbi:Hypothetical_protein [Hexamita inflata]|uniref:Hypothetical_protein n=1 Tax=Hexamita inflata TaxID=28002 RepID=A0AA86RMS1_9EUKA|nr:Hypothetical protein HINF_LOCUS62484 [Hexamita inflata]